jgi:hypothetical protein
VDHLRRREDVPRRGGQAARRPEEPAQSST